MSRVISLGYIGCTVSDPQQWDALLGPIFGLERRGDSPSDRTWYRMDSSHHRFTLHHGRTDRLEYIGWELGSLEDLRGLAESLMTQGEKVTHGDAALCEARRVMDL